MVDELSNPRPAKRGEGGERCEPGEGLLQGPRLPLTRLRPAAFGSLSPFHGERGKKDYGRKITLPIT